MVVLADSIAFVRRRSVKKRSKSFGSAVKPEKRPNDSPSHHKTKAVKRDQRQEEPRFTFDEVKEMIEKILSKQTRASPAVSAGLKKVNFDEIAAQGHSVESCKELIEQLVQSTRRVRSLQEVLVDIKDNLEKRTYTEIIQRASLKGELPKRPPSAYLLYHQDRYNELKSENALAVEVSKIVAEEWKVLSEKRRREYIRRHDELMQKYERDMQRLGLINEEAPKRPKAARSLFIEEQISDYVSEGMDKATLAQKKEEWGKVYDSLEPAKKQPWIDMQQDLVEKYKLARERYVESHPHLNHTAADKKSRQEKAKPPELPRSALKFFLQKKMPSGLDAQSYDETKKRLKEKFARLSEKKALKYIKRAIQDKERYDAEVKQFKEEHPGKEVPKTKANVTKEQWKLFNKVVENRPSLPAPNSYLHYCGRMLIDMNDNDDAQAPTARMQTASVAWKESSEREKKRAEQEHQADIERYIEEMDAWLAAQTHERRLQVLSEEPKANPDVWRKKLNKLRKIERKKKDNHH